MWSILATSHFGWETFGPLGLFAGLGLAFYGKAYKREVDRADRLEAVVMGVLPRVLRVVEMLEAEAEARRRR